MARARLCVADDTIFHVLALRQRRWSTERSTGACGGAARIGLLSLLAIIANDGGGNSDAEDGTLA